MSLRSSTYPLLKTILIVMGLFGSIHLFSQVSFGLQSTKMRAQYGDICKVGFGFQVGGRFELMDKLDGACNLGISQCNAAFDIFPADYDDYKDPMQYVRDFSIRMTTIEAKLEYEIYKRDRIRFLADLGPYLSIFRHKGTREYIFPYGDDVTYLYRVEHFGLSMSVGSEYIINESFSLRLDVSNMIMDKKSDYTKSRLVVFAGMVINLNAD
ncbi:MAG: hypothetical protein ACKVOK_03925 [Flavobacteriales bacterium]